MVYLRFLERVFRFGIKWLVWKCRFT